MSPGCKANQKFKHLIATSGHTCNIVETAFIPRNIGKIMAYLTTPGPTTPFYNRCLSHHFIIFHPELLPPAGVKRLEDVLRIRKPGEGQPPPRVYVCVFMHSGPMCVHKCAFSDQWLNATASICQKIVFTVVFTYHMHSNNQVYSNSSSNRPLSNAGGPMTVVGPLNRNRT